MYEPATDPVNSATNLPVPPTGLTAVSLSDTEIELAWRDNSAHESGYRVTMSRGTAGAWEAIVPDLAPDTISLRCTGLLPFTDYSFKVTAFNTSGESAPSNMANAVTKAAGYGAKAFTAFGFVSPAATGVIDEPAKTITVTVPHVTDVSTLVAVFITTGIGVKVGSTTQSGGISVNNFAAPVQYVVMALDGTAAT